MRTHKYPSDVTDAQWRLIERLIPVCPGGRPRTTANVDSQSVDTTSGGEQRGRDNAKNVDGRKRHIVVDSLGLLLAVLVTAAGVDDARAAAELFGRLEGQPVSKVRRVFADSK